MEIARANVNSLVSEAVNLLKNKGFAEGARKLREAKTLADSNSIAIPEYDLIDKKLWAISDNLLKQARTEIKNKKYKSAYSDIQTAKAISEDNADIIEKADALTNEMDMIVKNGIVSARQRIGKKDYERAYHYLKYLKDYFVNSSEVLSEIDGLIDGIKEKLENPDLIDDTAEDPGDAPKAHSVKNINIDYSRIAIVACAVAAVFGLVYFVRHSGAGDSRSRLEQTFYSDKEFDDQTSPDEEAPDEENSGQYSDPAQEGEDLQAKYDGQTQQSRETKDNEPLQESLSTESTGPVQQNRKPSDDEQTQQSRQTADDGQIQQSRQTVDKEQLQQSRQTENADQTKHTRQTAGSLQSDNADILDITDEQPSESDTYIEEMVSIGKQLRNGEDGEPDYERALEFFQAAADAGNAEAEKLAKDTVKYMELILDDGSVMSLEDQKRVVADYTGCSTRELRFLEQAIITDGRSGSLFNHLDSSGKAGELKILLMNDGDIFGYKTDGSLSDIKGYYR